MQLQLHPSNTEIRIVPVLSVCWGLNGLDIDWNEHDEHVHSDHFNVFFSKNVTGISEEKYFGMLRLIWSSLLKL